MTAPSLTHYQEGIYFSASAAETISGGQLVKAMSVGSAGTARPDQILTVMAADAANDDIACVGIAMTNAASGEQITVCTEGLFKMKCGAAVVAGEWVKPMAAAGSSDTIEAATLASCGAGSSLVIGRALNDAAANENAFVLLRV